MPRPTKRKSRYILNLGSWGQRKKKSRQSSESASNRENVPQEWLIATEYFVTGDHLGQERDGMALGSPATESGTVLEPSDHNEHPHPEHPTSGAPQSEGGAEDHGGDTATEGHDGDTAAEDHDGDMLDEEDKDDDGNSDDEGEGGAQNDENHR